MFDKVGKDCSNISCVKFDVGEIETFGIIMLINVLHSLNASSSINVVPSLRTAIFNEVQL